MKFWNSFFALIKSLTSPTSFVFVKQCLFVIHIKWKFQFIFPYVHVFIEYILIMELTIFKDTCTWSYELEACRFVKLQFFWALFISWNKKKMTKIGFDCCPTPIICEKYYHLNLNNRKYTHLTLLNSKS